MSQTKGGLEPAVIKNQATAEELRCMFNPNEYTVKKRNSWSSATGKGTNVPRVEFTQGRPRTLSVNLLFDTYAEGKDVRTHTDALWRMMQVDPNLIDASTGKSRPPYVELQWGAFSFRGVITSLDQKFTLFDIDGKPLRTTVAVSLQQAEDPDNPESQNPTSGGGPPMKTHIVQAGDRLDLIAYEMYEDTRHWRLIAKENAIVHPRRLREGQQLVIPPLS